MMRLPRFQYFAPRTVADAAALLAEHGPHASLVAGGTDLWPNMKRRQQTPTRVIGLRGVRALHGVQGSPSAGFTVGAMTSLSDVERDAGLAAAWPALGRAARLISTPPLRNMGTLGGNLCLDTRCNYWNQTFEWRKSIDFCLKRDGHVCWVAPGSARCWAVASSDTAPLLSAIGAEVTLVSVDGERRIAVRDLFRDDGIEYLNKRSNEILTAIHVPPQDGSWRASYRKLRRRGSFDFPVLGVAAAARVVGGVVAEARIVITGAGSLPHEATAAAAALVGKSIDDRDAVAEAVDRAARIAKPLDNTDFALGWRKEMARHHVTAALTDLA
ncbi:MAG TPA: FAD binding domain-containing protein [Polyangia bacterium]|nr:FAD binding domain-containing protein [Polyangia bacterium]